jgi:23S rRNA (guanosine2251-2'-O)-methyltransferase
VSEGSLIFGHHAVRAMLERSASRVQEVLVVDERHDKRMGETRELVEKAGLPLRSISRREMNHLLPETSHQGVAARLRAPRQWNEPDLPDLVAAAGQSALVLVLDGVQDPRNLGACMRTADAVGACAVVVPKDRAASLTPVARKVASGAAETVPLVRVTNLSRTLLLLREMGLTLVAADERGPAQYHEADLSGPLGLVMGAEGRGLRRLTLERCDVLVSLPMAGIVESLNVSVALGILAYEALRQRGT